MMSKDPIRVGIKSGTFYLSQNENGGSDWEKQEFLNPQTKEPMVKYHKNITVEGSIVYVGMKEDKFKGNCLSMLIKNDAEGTYSLEIPIVDTKGIKATNQYFNSLVGALEQLSKGDYVKMFINSKNKDKNDRLYRNVVVLDVNGSLVKSSFNFKDVPSWNSKDVVDDFGKSKKEYDPSPSNKFYIKKFQDIVERFKSETSQPTPEVRQEIKPEPTPIGCDDLPF